MELFGQIVTFLIFLFVYEVLYASSAFAIENDRDCKKLDKFNDFKLRNLLLMPILLSLVSHYDNSDISIPKKIFLFLGVSAVCIFLAKMLFAQHTYKPTAEIIFLFFAATFQLSLILVISGLGWAFYSLQ